MTSFIVSKTQSAPQERRIETEASREGWSLCQSRIFGVASERWKGDGVVWLIAVVCVRGGVAALVRQFRVL